MYAFLGGDKICYQLARRPTRGLRKTDMRLMEFFDGAELFGGRDSSYQDGPALLGLLDFVRATLRFECKAQRNANNLWGYLQ